MRLSRLLSGINECDYIVPGDPDISGLCDDSRRVSPGDCFVCVSGYQTDGHQYAAAALAKGARALVVERPLELEGEVVQVKVPSTRLALAHMAAEFFGQPGGRIPVIGITGTNGKTTTSYIIHSILQAAGQDPGLVGTVEIRHGGVTRAPLTTTPGSLELQETLARMVEWGAQAVVMEVSSHALSLDRILGIPFRVAVFTNLTQDHLDFHADLEEYFQAKLRLFRDLSPQGDPPGRIRAVINLDDSRAEQILAETRVGRLTYGFSPQAQVRARQVVLGAQETRLVVVYPGGEVPLNLQLLGKFNVYNALAAFAVGLALELPVPLMVGALESVEGVRGRFQRVHQGQPFSVVVDYGHTPDGLENILSAVREVTSGRLLAVFGCGGDRDRKKRPLMGEVAGRLADLVIVTSDNPRTEDPLAIIAEIEPGVKGTGREYQVEPDRRQAIRRALSLARPGDAVVIAGKGHEDYQILGKDKVHFDDVEEARQALRELAVSGSEGVTEWSR